MPRYVYASQILPGKADLVTQVYRQKREHPELVQEGDGFRQAIGLTGWDSWIHHSHRGDFFIHGLECNDLEELFTNLQQQIHEGHPRALWLKDFYLDILGKDYSHPSATPEVEPVLNLDIPGELNQQRPIVSRGFVYPLLPTKVNEHREFCRQCAGEHRMRVQDSCQQFGIVKHQKYIQKTPHQDYVVIYQEKVAWTPEEEKQVSEKAEQNPSWRWVSDVLRKHTGLKQEQLNPRVEPLCRTTPQQVNDWRPLATATT